MLASRPAPALPPVFPAAGLRQAPAPGGGGTRPEEAGGIETDHSIPENRACYAADGDKAAVLFPIAFESSRS